MNQDQIKIESNQFTTDTNNLRRNITMTNSQENTVACCAGSIWLCILLSLLTGSILCLVYGGIMVGDYNEYTGPQLDNDIEGMCTVTGKYITEIESYWTVVYNVTAKLEENNHYLQILQTQPNKKTAQTTLDNSNINTAPCWFDKTKKGIYEDGTWNYVDSSTNAWGIVLLIVGILLFCCGFMKFCCLSLLTATQMVV